MESAATLDNSQLSCSDISPELKALKPTAKLKPDQIPKQINHLHHHHPVPLPTVPGFCEQAPQSTYSPDQESGNSPRSLASLRSNSNPELLNIFCVSPLLHPTPTTLVWTVFVYKFFFIYVFLAALDLCCCMQAFSSCNAQASHCSGFSCCRPQALECAGFSSCSMWSQ